MVRQRVGLLLPLPRSDQTFRGKVCSGSRRPKRRKIQNEHEQTFDSRSRYAGKRVFIRVDFNVPLDGARVTDDTRIRETLPTLKLAMERGARLVLASHLGRPKGKIDPKYSLAPVAAKLGELLGKPVAFASDCVGADARGQKQGARRRRSAAARKRALSSRKKRRTIRNFRSSLRRSATSFLSCDAFGSAHRAHASVVGITKFVRQSAAGLLMEKELAYLGKAVSNPERPFVAVLGGAKVSDKIEVVQNLMKLADAMLIGGAMAYTFLKSQGQPVGKSLVENDKLDLARGLLEEARKRKFRLLLPVDHVLAESPDATAAAQTPASRTRRKIWMGLDVGPENHRRIQRGNRQSANHRMEWAARHVRTASLRAGYAGHGARRCRGDGSRRHLDYRRWRFRRRRRAVRRGAADFAYLDWRRRIARIPGRRETARRRSAQRKVASILAPSRDCRQLENVQDAARTRAFLSRLPAAGLRFQPLRHRGRSALHGARRVGRSDARLKRHDRRAERPRIARRRVYRRNFRLHAGRGRLHGRDHRPFRAARNITTRRTNR